MNDHKLSEALQNYFKQSIRADRSLDYISSLIEQTQSKASILQKQMQKSKQTITVLKWLMIFHKLLCQRSCSQELLSDLLQQLQNKPTNDFERMLTIKLIKPYSVYLQKRLITNFSDLDGSLKAFSITNMILRALSFVDILYTFGRYYTQQYPFFIDFNILMGIDIHVLYEELYLNINKNNKELLIEQIQKMHQKMYVVYYNCYFYKYLKPYVPRWIVTDNGTLSSSKSLNKTTTSLNYSSKSKKYEPTQFMAQSMILNGFNKEQDQLRLEAIKSMERIVSLFE